MMTIAAEIASEQEVREFVESTRFQHYQSVPLPHDLRTPGVDRSSVVDLILDDRVRGKSVLDVGTFYGLFPCEAMRRGASEAVGVERQPERYAIARRIAELHGNAYTVLEGTAEEIELGRTFDIVLFLNVLHHVTDPISVIRKLADLCSDTLIVEFALTNDPALRWHFYRDTPNPSLRQRLQANARYWLFRAAARGLPLMTVENRPERNKTFYISREAFYNMFVLHHQLFSEIEFLPSTRKHRTVALCKIRR